MNRLQKIKFISYLNTCSSGQVMLVNIDEVYKIVVVLNSSIMRLHKSALTSLNSSSTSSINYEPH